MSKYTINSLIECINGVLSEPLNTQTTEVLSAIAKEERSRGIDIVFSSLGEVAIPAMFWENIQSQWRNYYRQLLN